MIQAAISYGLDGLVFTDHHHLVPPERLEMLNRKHAPFQVFGGIEITVAEGEDVLVLGVQDPELELHPWTYRALVSFVRARDGFLVIAHPFRFRDTIDVDMASHPPDAIEVCSIHIGECDGPRVRAVQERLGLRPLCNSDAHRTERVGLYCSRLGTAIRDEQELLKALRAGDYVCCCDGGRVAAFNAEIDEREDKIRRMIAEGRDRDYYRETTGEWEGHFDRVAVGKTYRIQSPAACRSMHAVQAVAGNVKIP
jgi:hypothetical protein